MTSGSADGGALSMELVEDRSLPIVILAGSDRRPGPVPRGGERLHFVVGYKGAELELGGRCLAQLLVERLRASGSFGEIYLAGPRRVFDRLVDCEIIDTDGYVGRNIQVAIEAVRKRHGADTRLAMVSCDILPGAADIRALAADLLQSGEGEGGDPPALSLPLITAGPELGASGWKPKYRLRVQPEGRPVPFLPGHLGIAWPARLRLGLVYRLLNLLYRERNRDYGTRRREIVVRLLGALVYRDLANLVRLKPPTLTYRVLGQGLFLYRSWRRGKLDLGTLSRGVGAIMVRRRFFRAQGASAVRLVTSPLAAFAKDIDTREELEELARVLGEEDALP